MRQPVRHRKREQREEAQGTLLVESIAAGGDGVGRVDGLACFVPRTAPGDRAQVAYVAHARHARGRVLQLLAPSTARVAARCRHYEGDQCGGCQLQHMGDDAQRTARQGIVRDALARIGKRQVELPVLQHGRAWEYRGRLTLTLHRKGSGYVGGLHPYHDASRVFALAECPITHPVVVGAWLGLASRLRELPVARMLRLALRLMPSEDAPAGVMLLVEGGDTWDNADEWAATVMRANSDVHMIWWTRADGVRRMIAAKSELAGAVLPLPPVASPATASAVAVPGAHVDDLAPDGRDATESLAFAQVNHELAASLHAHVLELVRSMAPQRVVDAYAGVGVLTEQLARDGVTVTAIESDPSATARIAQRTVAWPATRVITATVEAGLPGALPADVIVLNPPRRGVDVSVTSLLAGAAARGVRAIVYVSCDPATLARDLARLPRWRIDRLQCFDMFPQTAHVETVCLLVPEVP